MKKLIEDEGGQFSIITALTGLLVIVFLFAIMPAILSANSGLLGTLAGHPVELAVAGLLPFVLIIAAIIGILGSGHETAQEVGY